MLTGIHGEKLYAHYNTWSEALYSMLRMEGGYTLYAIHGVKLCGLCYTMSEAICSSLYME